MVVSYARQQPNSCVPIATTAAVGTIHMSDLADSICRFTISDRVQPDVLLMYVDACGLHNLLVSKPRMVYQQSGNPHQGPHLSEGWENVTSNKACCTAACGV
jgi:hypothetical protein